MLTNLTAGFFSSSVIRMPEARSGIFALAINNTVINAQPNSIQSKMLVIFRWLFIINHI